MACNTCESGFNSAMPVVTSIVKSGTTGLLYLQNAGRSIAHIRRILLCYGGTTLYLRPGTFTGPEYLEQGTTVLYYSFTPPAGSIVQAQAEYVEITSRSRSCAEQF